MSKRLAGYYSAIIVLLLAFSPGLLAAQTAPSGDIKNPLLSLITALSEHTKTPDQVLDPVADPAARVKNIEMLSDSHYELSLTPTDSVSMPTGDVATVPIRVHFKTATSELNASATAQFIRRDGTWYFANFDFLAIPVFLITILVFCCGIGVSYATTVLVLRQRLVKRGQLNAATMAQLFIPFFWGSLFRKTRIVG